MANARPQPAIPSLLVFLLTLMSALSAAAPGSVPDPTELSAAWLLVPLGFALSCGLAIAAGFCSVFPQLAWIALGAWALRFVAPAGPLPAYNRWVLGAGLVVCVLMLGLQIWRVATGRFVPTISTVDDETIGAD
ncbi:MAG: hypothetical protein D6727_09075 [Gammaproteobacteria bacterium]|nr:MAG: hypothetical protein D6727_09075 [Gammaproteobacteria bacterium]